MEGIGRRYGISAAKCNVESCGVATPEQLIKALKNADVFVLPSYIENSPNSLCEAQMLGLPCVATNVGGVASLVKDGVNGILVPANDPVMMADAVMRICNDENMAIHLGENVAEIASKRHAKRQIVQDAIEGYRCLRRN